MTPTKYVMSFPNPISQRDAMTRFLKAHGKDIPPEAWAIGQWVWLPYQTRDDDPLPQKAHIEFSWPDPNAP